MRDTKVAEFRTLLGRMLTTLTKGVFYCKITPNSLSLYTFDETKYEIRFLVELNSNFFNDYTSNVEVTLTTTNLRQVFFIVMTAIQMKVFSAYTDN